MSTVESRDINFRYGGLHQPGTKRLQPAGGKVVPFSADGGCSP